MEDLLVFVEHKEAERILTIIRGFPMLKDREPKFKWKEGVVGGVASYDWLINTWMPSQRDFDVLVELTVLLNFEMEMVVAALMGEDRFLLSARQVAARNKIL